MKSPLQTDDICWPVQLACAAAIARAQRAVALSVQNSGQETFTQQEQADKNAKRKR